MGVLYQCLIPLSVQLLDVQMFDAAVNTNNRYGRSISMHDAVTYTAT